MVSRAVLLGLALLFFVYSANSLSQEASEESPDQTRMKKKEKPIRILDIPHQFVSNNIELISRKLDMFFSNETIYEESTGSYIRIREDLVWKKGGEVTYRTNIRSKLELPKSKKKLQLLIRNEDEQEEESARSSFTGAATDSDYSTSLRRLLKMTKHLNAHVDAGVKLKSRLDPFVRIRMRTDGLFGNTKIRGVESVSWFDSEGWRSSSLLEFRTVIFSKSLFRIASELLLGNRKTNADFIQSFAIYHGEHRNIFYYEVSGLATDKPNVQAQQYVAKALYKNSIYKDWLYMAIGPQLNFNRESGFRTEPELLFQLEANFGGMYQ